MVFVIVFLAYSVIQIMLFGPSFLAEAVALKRICVIRLYYFIDGVSLIVGGFLLVSLFDYRQHRHPISVAAIVAFILTGGYFLIFTSAMVDGLRPGPAGLEFSKPAEYVYLGRAMVYISTAVVLIALCKTFISARSNHAQIKNVYALVAALIYNLSCLLGVYKVYPFLMSTRGVIFYVVVVLILQRNRWFDIRPVTPATLEANTLRDLSRTFRQYAGEDIGHREAMKRLETTLVSYKLERITGFKDGKGSSLPLVAESMQLKLSSLYDLLKRLKIRKPENKND
jgi:hypothetical protein